jgi:hypothetical protein
MTRQNRDGRASRFEEIFHAYMARHEAHMARAMAAHERAMAAVELRMAGAMRAHELALAAAERRVEDVLRRDRGKGRGMPPKDSFKRRWGKRRPDEEGGEPMPAVPRPKPKPLAGGAAAPIG